MYFSEVSKKVKIHIEYISVNKLVKNSYVFMHILKLRILYW